MITHQVGHVTLGAGLSFWHLRHVLTCPKGLCLFWRLRHVPELSPRVCFSKHCHGLRLLSLKLTFEIIAKNVRFIVASRLSATCLLTFLFAEPAHMSNFSSFFFHAQYRTVCSVFFALRSYQATLTSGVQNQHHK